MTNEADDVQLMELIDLQAILPSGGPYNGAALITGLRAVYELGLAARTPAPLPVETKELDPGAISHIDWLAFNEWLANGKHMTGKDNT
jgi:hypothetical protein